MAEFLTVPGLSLREEPLPGPDAAGETEAELSLSLARIKTRSYGSTASVVAPLAERYLEHRLSPGDTLQGIALKYGVSVAEFLSEKKVLISGHHLLNDVTSYLITSLLALSRCHECYLARCMKRVCHPCFKASPETRGWIPALVITILPISGLQYQPIMEQIKRANKLFTNDCIFLRKTLNIPVMTEKPLLFNGFNLLESPENEADSPPSCEEPPVTVQEDNSSPSPQEPDNPLPPPDELSAKDFLHRLDLQIKLSKQAAKKLKPEDIREDDEENPYATSSYQQ